MLEVQIVSQFYKNLRLGLPYDFLISFKEFFFANSYMQNLNFILNYLLESANKENLLWLPYM